MQTQNDPDREKYRQRRRYARTDGETGDDQISKEIRESYDLVPEAGAGYRWYDWPHRMLWWLGTGWRYRAQPRALTARIWQGINWLGTFNEFDRDKAWRLDSSHHNVFVPPDEHVSIPGIWVVELFPPTKMEALESALRRNRWNTTVFSTAHERDNQQRLTRARTANGTAWWSLAEVIAAKSGWVGGADAKYEPLPTSFLAVSIRAVQVGQGVTALVAHFRLSDEAQESVDEVWHSDHEPMIVRGPPRWRSLDRGFAARRRTQLRRRALHTDARSWLEGKAPGYFAAKRRPQPLIDMLLLDKLDPTVAPRANMTQENRRRRAEAYEALGLSLDGFRQIRSKRVSKLLLHEPSRRELDALGVDPTWTLWGRRKAIAKAGGKDSLNHGNTDSDRVLASRLGKSAYSLFVMLAVGEYLSCLEEDYAMLRDRASTRYGRFRPSKLRDLRNSFLTLSLDLSSLRLDLKEFWAQLVRWGSTLEFESVEAPEYAARRRREGREPPATFPVNDSIRGRQLSSLAGLRAADREYRDILSTVASLGASADSTRLGRLALVVATVTLLVAVVGAAGC